MLLSCCNKCDQLGIDQNHEDVKELNHIIDKLKRRCDRSCLTVEWQSLSICRFLMSISLLSAIKTQPMEWCSNRETDSKKYGSSTSPGALTVEDTKKKIHDVLKYVCRLTCRCPFLFVGTLLVAPQSEAGCYILTNTLLIPKMHLEE